MPAASPFRLAPLTPLTNGFVALEEESRQSGLRMLGRLREEWESGVNRFDGPADILFGAFDGHILVGIGGRTIDPFENNTKTGRVRHVYVAQNLRRLGIGRLLVERILSDAGLYFTRINVRAPAAAFGFYEGLGFVRIDGIDTATHHLTL